MIVLTKLSQIFTFFGLKSVRVSPFYIELNSSNNKMKIKKERNIKTYNKEAGDADWGQKNIFQCLFQKLNNLIMISCFRTNCNN